MTTTDAKLAVALVALSKIAHGPSFAGRSADQMAAKQALDTIKAMEEAPASRGGFPRDDPAWLAP
jgi:hypothetical protein